LCRRAQRLRRIDVDALAALARIARAIRARAPPTIGPP
jgi:hypothetical protein